MAVILAVVSAAVYGAADFLGGVATRRSTAFAVVVWSQLAGLVALAAAAAVMGDAPAPARDLAWGAVGGLGGGTGVVLLYRGLSIGRMSVVAPTSAVIGAVLPVLVGLGLGERPHAAALAGVAVALLAIILVSSGPDGSADAVLGGRVRPGLREAVGAGMGFALFFVALANAGDDAGLWPLLAARVSIVVAAVGGLVTRSALRPAPGAWGRIVVVGLLDMTSNLLYVLATRRGLLSLVAVLVSLYPASTVLLARVVLGERMTGRQVVGLVAAGAGVALIAAV